MLLAETHGKGIHSTNNLQDVEDYLTSAVFGHLRYLPPRVFWKQFLSRATCAETSRCESLTDSGVRIEKYRDLKIRFWPQTEYGEPDLALLFSGGQEPATLILIEAKLWAGESGRSEDSNQPDQEPPSVGSGENTDAWVEASRGQLVKYLALLNDDGALNRARLDPIPSPLPDGAVKRLLYLTPGGRSPEFVKIAEGLRNPDRLFHAEWADIAWAAVADAGEQHRDQLILDDVDRFLEKRGLGGFRGFHFDDCLDFGEEEGRFYACP